MDATAALIGVAAMIVLMLLRMPVSFALMATGFVGAMYLLDFQAAVSLLSGNVWNQLSSYSLAAIPMFVLMGQIAFRAGISERLFTTAYHWVGSRPGGIAATTILASLGFSAISGSNSATTATMGSAALPRMKEYGYSPALAGGSVAIGGTLGVVIPPSTALIIIAIQTEQSIKDLFVAAVLPGVILGVLLLLTVLGVCWVRPSLGPPAPKFGWAKRLRSLLGVGEAVLLFAVVIGGIYLGWFTPSEAGAAGAFGALAIAAARRTLTLKALWQAVQETLRITAMVVLLITGAVVFGTFLTLTRVPTELATWTAELAIPTAGILVVILLIYIIGGAVMDALGFLVLSLPIFFPLAESLGYDPVWFTVILTLVTTLGAVTPPVGVNVYIVSALDKDLNVATTFKGVSMFIVTYVVALAVFIAFPGLIPTG